MHGAVKDAMADIVKGRIRDVEKGEHGVGCWSKLLDFPDVVASRIPEPQEHIFYSLLCSEWMA